MPTGTGLVLSLMAGLVLTWIFGLKIFPVLGFLTVIVVLFLAMLRSENPLIKALCSITMIVLVALGVQAWPHISSSAEKFQATVTKELEKPLPPMVVAETPPPPVPQERSVPPPPEVQARLLPHEKWARVRARIMNGTYHRPHP